MSAFKDLVAKMFPDSKKLSEINPDKVVAIGAAKMAAILEGRLKNVELSDILSHSLGVLDDDDQFVPIIERGTVYPCVETKLFTNTRGNQTSFIIKVLQKREDDLVELSRAHISKGLAKGRNNHRSKL